MSRWWRQEEGSTSIIFLFTWSVALITIAFAIDVGRLFVIREQLRTAEEAAALAGVLQAQYMVEAQFMRLQNQPYLDCWPPGPDGEGGGCEWVDNWVEIDPAVIQGPEAQTWPNAWQLWSHQCSGRNIRCDPTYSWSACWVEPRGGWASVKAASLEAFTANQRWGTEARLEGPVGITLETGNQIRPRWLKVRVEATLEMETFLLTLIGTDSLLVSTPGKITEAELVRRSEESLKVWINGAQVPSPCLLP